MRIRQIVLPWLVVAAGCATNGTIVRAQQSPERLVVNLSDPSKPATVRVHVLMGRITVRGVSRKDVQIEARSRSGWRIPQGDTTGLRRLTQSPEFSVEEEHNEVTVSSSIRRGRGTDFDIQVPTRTNLRLSTLTGGELLVDDVEGEIEVNNVNGPITLTKVSGSVVAHSVNGSVKTTFARVMPEKAMAFTSLNGSIDVTLPPSTKANLKLRSDMGDVFTDFDVQLRPTRAATVDDLNRGKGRFRIEVNKSISGTINGGGPELELRTFNGSVYVRKGT